MCGVARSRSFFSVTLNTNSKPLNFLSTVCFQVERHRKEVEMRMEKNL